MEYSKKYAKENHRSITISKDNFDTLVSLGDMTKTFNDVVSDLIEKANIKSSAGAELEDDNKG